MEEPPRVVPLTQVKLAVESAAAATDPPASCSEVAFIYGIGSGGLLPFECLLAGKPEGDTVCFHLAKARAADFFGHLTARFLDFFDGDREVFFRARILRVETPAPREIIRAIAATTAYGHADGCDCGCGCR